MTSVFSQVSQKILASGAEITTKITLILLLAGMASIAFRRGPAAVRHLVATVAIGLTLLMPWLMKFGPQWRVPILPPPASISPAISTAKDELPSTPSVSAPQAEDVIPPRSHRLQETRLRKNSDSRSAREQVLAIDTTPPAIAATGKVGLPLQKMDWRSWSLAAWLMGVLLFLGKIGVSS